MPAKIPRSGFFVAIGFGALAIVIGAGAVLFECLDHTRHFGIPAIELSLGLVLMIVTLLGESSGPRQRIFLVLRNALLGLFCVVVLLVFLYGLVGPLR